MFSSMLQLFLCIGSSIILCMNILKVHYGRGNSLGNRRYNMLENELP
ncbi:hypothetical protein M2277_005613 [Paenibacillus sp. LBL]|nr:hypothetical protein [Paenibacillus sp. LBL]